MIKGMSRMSLILILSYRLKEVTNSHVLEIQKISSYLWNQIFSDCNGVWIKMKVKVDYIENSKLNIADM